MQNKKAIDMHANDIIRLNGIDFNVMDVQRLIICGRCEVVRAIVLVPESDGIHTSLLFEPEEMVLAKEGLLN